MALGLRRVATEVTALARDGGARRLWLTHFVPSLSDPSAHLGHVRAVFPRAIVSYTS